MPEVSIQIDPLSAAVAVTSLLLTLRMQRKARQVGRSSKKQASQKSLLRPESWTLSSNVMDAELRKKMPVHCWYGLVRDLLPST